MHTRRQSEVASFVGKVEELVAQGRSNLYGFLVTYMLL